MSLGLWFWTLLTGSRLKGLQLEGRRLLKKGDLSAALRNFREVGDRWPDRVEGYEGLEKVYKAMGLFEEAQREAIVAAALKALKDNPDDHRPRLRLANELVAKQKYAVALPHVEIALKTAPQDQQVLRLAGLVMRHNRQPERALELVGQALDQEPLDPELYEEQSFILRALNRVLEASQALSVANALRDVAREPANQEAMERAVLYLSAVRRRRQALPLLERSLGDYPQAAGLRYLRAELLVEQGRLDEAQAELSECLALEPVRLRAHALLANVYRQMDRQPQGAFHAKVAEMLEQARKAPDRVDAERLVIEALLLLKQLERAEERAENLCRKYPQDWRSLAIMGKVRKIQGRGAEAMDFYRQAARLDQKAPEPFMAMAWLHGQAGQVKDAIHQARQGVAAAPRDPVVRRQMADLLEQLGFGDLAKEERELAEAMDKAYSTPDGF